jgi:hypothetical protein
MPFITKSGEVLPLEICWNGFKNCLTFTVREGQSFGEAVCLSDCSCAFCHMLRTEDGAEDLDIEETDLQSAQRPRIRLCYPA